MREKHGEARTDSPSHRVRHPVQKFHGAAGDPVLVDFIERSRHHREKQALEYRPFRGNAGLPPPQGAQKPHHAIEPEVVGLVREPEGKVDIRMRDGGQRKRQEYPPDQER
jgi:hypothetical protein